MNAPIRQSQFERCLIDIAGDLVATAAPFAKREAEYRANRDTANVVFDARRDADLIRLGYIDAPAGREAA